MGWRMESTRAKRSFGEDSSDNCWTRCYRIALSIAKDLSTSYPQNNNEMAVLLSKISDREFEMKRGVGSKTADYRKQFIERHYGKK